jgi:hypothetical protein
MAKKSKKDRSTGPLLVSVKIKESPPKNKVRAVTWKNGKKVISWIDDPNKPQRGPASAKKSMSLSELEELAKRHAMEDLRDGTYPNPRPPLNVQMVEKLRPDIKRMKAEQFLLGVITGGVVVVSAQAYRMREELISGEKILHELIELNEELVRISNKMSGILVKLQEQ